MQSRMRIKNVIGINKRVIASTSTQNKINLFQVQILPSLALYLATRSSKGNAVLPLNP